MSQNHPIRLIAEGMAVGFVASIVWLSAADVIRWLLAL
jgi:hypothetical protein